MGNLGELEVQAETTCAPLSGKSRITKMCRQDNANGKCSWTTCTHNSVGLSDTRELRDECQSVPRSSMNGFLAEIRALTR
jgi:hypothetical protein